MRGIALLSPRLRRCSLPAPAARAPTRSRCATRALAATDDGLVLDARFRVRSDPRLAEAVANGVPLYFLRRVRAARAALVLVRREVSAPRALQLRLSYHALSRHTGCRPGRCSRAFATLEEALNVLTRVRNWLVVDRAAPLGRRELRGRACACGSTRPAAQAVPGERAHQPRTWTLRLATGSAWRALDRLERRAAERAEDDASAR